MVTLDLSPSGHDLHSKPRALRFAFLAGSLGAFAHFPVFCRGFESSKDPESCEPLSASGCQSTPSKVPGAPGGGGRASLKVSSPRHLLYAEAAAFPVSRLNWLLKSHALCPHSNWHS